MARKPDIKTFNMRIDQDAFETALGENDAEAPCCNQGWAIRSQARKCMPRLSECGLY